MRHKIFFSILVTFLFFAKASFALVTVPEGTPLQPIPQNTVPNINQNVNSIDSTYSQNQRQEQEQISPPSPSPAQSGNEDTTSPAPDTNVVLSTEPIWLYWGTLILGSLGLVAALSWLYWRFRK